MPQIIVLDYPGMRTEARIMDLGIDSLECCFVDLLQDSLPEYSGISEYSKQLLNKIPENEETVAILSYCATLAIAEECLRQISSSSRAPALITFNQVRSTLQDVQDAYESAVKKIGDSPRPVLVVDHAESISSFLLAVRRDLYIRSYEELFRRDYPLELAKETSIVSAKMYMNWIELLATSTLPTNVQDVSFESLRIFSSDFALPDIGHSHARTAVVNCRKEDLLRADETRTVVTSYLRKSVVH